MKRKTSTKDDVEDVLTSIEQQIEVPREAEERFLQFLPDLFANVLARSQFGDALARVECEIEVPADAEERAVASILKLAVLSPNQPRQTGSVPPISGDRFSTPSGSEESHSSNGVKSRS